MSSQFAALSAILLSTLIGCAAQPADSTDPQQCTGKCDDGGEVSAAERLRWDVGTCKDNYETGMEVSDTPDDSMEISAEYAACVARAVDRAVPAVEAQFPDGFAHDETALLDAVSDLRNASACQIVGEAVLSSWDAHMAMSLCQADGETLIAHEIATLALGLQEEHTAYDHTTAGFYAQCGDAFDRALDTAGTQAQIADATEVFAACVRNKIQNEISPRIALHRQDVGLTQLGIQDAIEEVNVELDAHFDHVNTFCAAVTAPGAAAGWGAPAETGLCKARGFAELGKQLGLYFPAN